MNTLKSTHWKHTAGCVWMAFAIALANRTAAAPVPLVGEKSIVPFNFKFFTAAVPPRNVGSRRETHSGLQSHLPGIGAVTVPAPFYRSGWFRVVLGIAGAFALFGILFGKLRQMKSRHQQLQAEKMALEAEVAKQIAELATTREALRKEVVERSQAEEKTRAALKEQSYSLSLLNATLESSPNGIAVFDRNGRLLSRSPKLGVLWNLPPELLDHGTQDELLQWGAKLVTNPKEYLEKVESRRNQIDQAAVDVFDLIDGRTFERYVRPQMIGDECVGQVVLFRDITARKRAETELFKSESLMRSIMDHSAEVIFVKDLEFRFVFMNAAGCRLSGLPSERIIGHSKAEFHSDEVQAAKILAHDAHVIQSRQTETVEEEIAGADGVRHVFLTTKVPRLDKQGNVIGLVGVAHDITDRKAAEVELAFERDLLRGLLDNSTDYIYFKDAQSRFILSSRAQARQLGADSAEDVIGKTDFDFFSEEHARPAFADEQAIIRTGQPIIGQVEKECWTDGRKETWVITTKMPLRNRTGEIIGTFGISKDITSLKESEAKLEEVHRQLLETSRRAGMAEVATSVLHNIGNVLNSVNVSASVVAEVAQDSKSLYLEKVVSLLNEHLNDLGGFLTSDPKGRQLPAYLGQLAEQLGRERQKIIAELELLRKNIDHIKDIVAMQQSYAKISGVTETVNVSELVEDALRMNAGALDRHQITLIRDYADLPPVVVEKHKVLQILVNLIRNAKYACDDSGRPDKQLKIQISSTHAGVSIALIDNGIGIPAENLPRIFNLGFSTRTGGHGFGLHSGALAARELGGSLSVQSHGSQQGATFVLALPLQPPKTES